jgi:hypothetical protein
VGSRHGCWGGRLDGLDNDVATVAVSVHDDVPPDGLRDCEATARSDHHTFTQNRRCRGIETVVVRRCPADPNSVAGPPLKPASKCASSDLPSVGRASERGIVSIRLKRAGTPTRLDCHFGLILIADPASSRPREGNCEPPFISPQMIDKS